MPAVRIPRTCLEAIMTEISEAQSHARAIKDFWAAQGVSITARVVPVATSNGGLVYGVKTNLVNGLPPKGAKVVKANAPPLEKMALEVCEEFSLSLPVFRDSRGAKGLIISRIVFCKRAIKYGFDIKDLSEFFNKDRSTISHYLNGGKK